MSSSQSESFYFSCGEVPMGMAYPVSIQNNQWIEKKVCKRMMGSKSGDVLWSANDNGLPKSFLGLIQIYSDKVATSLKCNALVSYPVHAVCLNFTAKRRRYLIDHG